MRLSECHHGPTASGPGCLRWLCFAQRGGRSRSRWSRRRCRRLRPGGRRRKILRLYKKRLPRGVRLARRLALFRTVLVGRTVPVIGFVQELACATGHPAIGFVWRGRSSAGGPSWIGFVWHGQFLRCEPAGLAVPEASTADRDVCLPGSNPLHWTNDSLFSCANTIYASELFVK